jgi:hypothetical protein
MAFRLALSTSTSHTARPPYGAATSPQRRTPTWALRRSVRSCSGSAGAASTRCESAETSARRLSARFVDPAVDIVNELSRRRRGLSRRPSSLLAPCFPRSRIRVEEVDPRFSRIAGALDARAEHPVRIPDLPFTIRHHHHVPLDELARHAVGIFRSEPSQMLRLVREGAKLEDVADSRKILGDSHSVELKLSGALDGPTANFSAVAPILERDDAVRIDAIEAHDRASYPDRRLLVHRAAVMRLHRADAREHGDRHRPRRCSVHGLSVLVGCDRAD